MNTSEIIKEIRNLPIHRRIYIIEKTLQAIRKEEDTNQLRNAAEVLHSEYKTDKVMMAFTILDFENFYEAM